MDIHVLYVLPEVNKSVSKNQVSTKNNLIHGHEMV